MTGTASTWRKGHLQLRRQVLKWARAKPKIQQWRERSKQSNQRSDLKRKKTITKDSANKLERNRLQAFGPTCQSSFGPCWSLPLLPQICIGASPPIHREELRFWISYQCRFVFIFLYSLPFCKFYIKMSCASGLLMLVLIIEKGTLRTRPIPAKICPFDLMQQCIVVQEQYLLLMFRSLQ